MDVAKSERRKKRIKEACFSYSTLQFTFTRNWSGLKYGKKIMSLMMGGVGVYGYIREDWVITRGIVHNKSSLYIYCES